MLEVEVHALNGFSRKAIVTSGASTGERMKL